MAYRHSDQSAQLSLSDSEVLSTLTSHGGNAFVPALSEYVIHTHTVPLASTVDMHYLRTEGVKSQFHGYKAGNRGDECPKRACMFVNKQGRRSHDVVPENCPCLKVEGKNGLPLKPRCFLTYIRSLGRHLASDHEEAYTMKPESIMFCQTHTGLFDNKYPGWFRDAIGVSGWEHVTARHLVPSLRSLYWFRTYAKILKLDVTVEEQLQKVGFRQTRHAIMQAIHTLNGVLIKKFMAFCTESTRYQDYAKQTAYLFRDLFLDYTHPLVYRGGRLVEPEDSTYGELKEYLNTVKKCFHRFSIEERLKWLDFEFKSKSLRRMFNEVTRLKALVTVKSIQGIDYSESPAWFFRCSTLCQTRVLGYLPRAIAEVKRKQFRDNVSRPLEKPPKANILLIRKSVGEELRRNGIPRAFMQTSEWKSHDRSTRFQEAMAAIELPLKGSASVDNFVRQGGKIEDARQILNLAIENKWKIPVRDLSDHEVIETFTVGRVDDCSSSEYTRPLFWIAYTALLNFFVKKGFYPQQLYYSLRKKGGTWDPNPLLASIVHISEPGKERNLTKSTGLLAWFLTPASKITQDTLSVLPEHAAGLTAASHEWRHQKRVSAISDESSFIYDISTGFIKPGIVHSFKDWTESTDFIGKYVGWAHLKTLLDYIAFPEGYRDLIAHAIMEPQPVVEVVALTNFEDAESVSEPVEWTGFINEGFMMGNPMTKTVLHLCHVSERCVTRELIGRMGGHEGPKAHYRGLGDPVRLDRSEVSAWQRPSSLWS